MPRRSSSRSTDTRSHTTPSPPYDYPPSASRNPTPNTHAGVSAYPFPADDQGTYTAQPTQATPYTTANGVTYVQRAQGPSYHHAPVPTYPNGTSQSYSSAPSSTYSHPVPMGRTRSRDPSPTYSYGVPQVATPYDEITRPREPSPARGRPSMRRGDPYDSMAPTPTPSVPPQPPMRRNSSERRMSESAPSAPRLPNAQPSGASALARVDSHQLYRRSMQQDNAGSWNGEKSSRSSVALVSLRSLSQGQAHR